MYESTRARDNAITRRLVQVLQQRPAGLVTDMDGTISPIVRRPEDAAVLPEARDALERLQSCLDLVAVVSGRAIGVVRQMIPLTQGLYAGNHGLERWGLDGYELAAEAEPWVARIEAVTSELANRLAAKGVLVENKGGSATLHYRTAPNPPEARKAILEALADGGPASQLMVEEGRMVVNLLPPVGIDKGSAIDWLVELKQLRSVVYVGDDVTDTHAFRRLRSLRHEGLQTLNIGVIGSGSPPEVAALADATVACPQELASILHAVADELRC